MIFYGALQERVYVDTDPLKMPIVDVEISGPFVLGFGPALISFFVLAITGTMRATRTARTKLNLGRGDWNREELDTSPNALDLAFYPPRQSQRLSRLSPTSATWHSWLSACMEGRVDSEAAGGC